MLDTPSAGEDTDTDARRIRRRFDAAAALLDQVQAELRAARSGAGVDWPRLLARVDTVNALLLQVIAQLEERRG